MVDVTHSHPPGMDLVTGPQLSCRGWGSGFSWRATSHHYITVKRRESVVASLQFLPHTSIYYTCCGRAHQTLHNSFPLERVPHAGVVWGTCIKDNLGVGKLFFVEGQVIKRWCLVSYLVLVATLSTLSWCESSPRPYGNGWAWLCPIQMSLGPQARVYTLGGDSLGNQLNNINQN